MSGIASANKEPRELPQGLIRQRRNIFVASLIILFFSIGKPSIKSLKFPFFDSDVNNPEVVIVFVWIFFFYALLRYYQYFAELGDKRVVDRFWSEFSARVGRFGKLYYEPSRNEFGENAVRTYKINKNRVITFFQNGKDQVICNVDHKDSTGYSAQADFPLRRHALQILASVWTVVVKQQDVTDLYLPFAVALISLVVALLVGMPMLG